MLKTASKLLVTQEGFSINKKYIDKRYIDDLWLK